MPKWSFRQRAILGRYIRRLAPDDFFFAYMLSVKRKNKKLELMLTRRTKAYSSFGSVV